jgi:hypothetical protein
VAVPSKGGGMVSIECPDCGHHYETWLQDALDLLEQVAGALR